MRPRLIWAIFAKDLRDGLRNYQVLLMLLTPIVLSLVFNRILGESRAEMHLPRIGILGIGNPQFVQTFLGSESRLRIDPCETRDELVAKILEGRVAIGLVMPRLFGIAPSATAPAQVEADPGREPASGSGSVQPGTVDPLPEIEVLVGAGLPQFSRDTLESTLRHGLRKFLHVPEPELPVRLTIRELGQAARRRARTVAHDSMPMMVLMAIGMVGFLGLPMAFVEEKERRTLQAMMLTPVSTGELILGKSLYGVLLILIPVMTIVTINQQWGGAQWLFWSIIVLASLLCLFIGLFIALFAQTQAAVNGIGTSLFLVFQLVPSLMMNSETLRMLAPFVPSTFIQDGMRKALFLELNQVDWQHDLSATVAWTLGAYLILFLTLKYRRQRLQ